MSGEDIRAGDRFDRFLDDLARGRPPAAVDVDPTVAGAARFTHDLGARVVPDPTFVTKLEEDLMNRPLTRSVPVPATVLSSPNGRALPRLDVSRHPVAGGRGRAPVVLATAAALLLIVTLGFGAFRLTSPSGQAETPAGVSAPAAVADPIQPVSLLAWDMQGRRVTPLDSATLIDLPRGPILESSSGATTWHASADGLTLVSVENGSVEDHDDANVILRDGRTGEERNRFHPPTAPVYNPRLSRDGAILVLQTSDIRLAWVVVDVATGRETASIDTDDDNAFGPVDYWLDPTGTYLDVLVCDCTGQRTGPASAQLVRLDLSTGDEVDRLDLPEVIAGIWPTGRADDGEPIRAHLTPGGAASPDGQQLAIVHADGLAVTLVDLGRFVVEHTQEVTRPTGPVNRVMSLLPFVPQSAAAKAVTEGTLRAATFHPDGRHLYVTGFENWRNPRGGEDRRGLGLQLIDLETGELKADVSGDAQFRVVGIAPDGASLYVVGGTPDETDSGGTLLRRLDATTLAPLAERQFERWPEILLLPVALNAIASTP